MDPKEEETINEEDHKPPALTRWLWFTLIVLIAGLVLVAGRLILNCVIIKVMEKSQSKEDNEEKYSNTNFAV